MSPRTPSNWHALWALCLGFFMVMVDSTIVQVALPAFMTDLGVGVSQAIWVTSSYLLGYAFPLLITGRLGDRLGPRRVYLAGLAGFTAASAACAMAPGIWWLIAARVVQGIAAAVLTPQTMAVITRVFSPQTRGPALGAWGAVAGVAALVGPVAGGLLVDLAGWRWVFLVNLPVGVIGLVLAARWVPELPTSAHRFDWFGVFLSASGLFCVVFAIQEAHTFSFGRVAGPVTITRLLGSGLAALILFVAWQARTRAEPLMPLRLFTDRNFSLANLALATATFAVTATAFPYMIWAQQARGMSPTAAALLTAPQAVIAAVAAPLVGRLLTVHHPRNIAVLGLGGYAGGLLWLRTAMSTDGPTAAVLAPYALLGLANACIWSPLSVTVTANLPTDQAGAGSGVYNTIRQVGAVLGSAAIGLVLSAPAAASVNSARYIGVLGDALLVPAGVALGGAVLAAFFVRPRHQRSAGRNDDPPASSGG